MIIDTLIDGKPDTVQIEHNWLPAHVSSPTKKVGKAGSRKGTRPPKELFNLGLAISGAMLGEGEHRTLRDLAIIISATIEVMTGKPRPVSWQAISRIEQIALRKCRAALYRNKSLYDEFKDAILKS